MKTIKTQIQDTIMTTIVILLSITDPITTALFLSKIINLISIKNKKEVI